MSYETLDMIKLPNIRHDVNYAEKDLFLQKNSKSHIFQFLVAFALFFYILHYFWSLF